MLTERVGQCRNSCGCEWDGERCDVLTCLCVQGKLERGGRCRVPRPKLFLKKKE